MIGIVEEERSSGAGGPAGRATDRAVQAAGTAPGPAPGLIRHRSVHTLLGLVLVVPLMILIPTVWADDGVVRETLEWLGYGAIVVCVLGRAWCMTYIAGRKKAELVDRGPYSVVRNPLYVFSLFGLAGIGLQTGSIIWSAFVMLSGALYFSHVVRREELYLLEAFPTGYPRYTARTPRWIPDPHAWLDATQVTIRPVVVARSLLDGACFFAAFPLFEALADAHAAGVLPTLLAVP